MSKETAHSLKVDGLVTVWKLYEGDASEIAKDYQLGKSTVYRLMREYCKANGKVYESYLRQPHRPYLLKRGKFRLKSPVTATKTPPRRGKVRVRRIPLAQSIEEEFEYMRELIKSSMHSDVLEGISLLEAEINNMLKR